ncbi:MAG: chemotaxis protein CheA [Hyphomicrobiales bacterium]|nr:chemotaxis protein CheA [Hyphomicrobiales bacterium]
MASLDQLKQTFFDECAEGMQQIEQGLSDMRDGLGSDDTINAVFRAVHSVKGGAGIFGFEALVGFAHVFETTLDVVRRGDLAATTDVVDTLLAASDVLSDLVQISRAGDPIPAGFGDDCRHALERLLGTEPAGDEAAPADFDGLDFVPVRADAAEPDDMADFDGIDFTPVKADAFADGPRSFAFVFRPNADMLRNGSDPLLLMRQLRQLGELNLSVDAERLPELITMRPEIPYLGWTGTLRTEATREQLQDIFDFVGDCEITITEIGADDGKSVIGDSPVTPLPVADAAPPVVPAAAIAPAQAAAVDPAPQPVNVVPMPQNERAPARAAEASSERAAARPSKPQATTTRIELEKIDRVVNMVGELVIAQAMLGQIVHDLPEGVSDRLSQILDEVVHHTRELKDGLMSMRAQAVGTVFQRMPRLVRETAAKVGKKIRLELSGETTEVDRSIIERLTDPLTHIIRNSVDHGIEPPAVRLAAGKSEEGIIRLSAEHRGGRIVIEVSDDGGGINTEKVLQKAREKGLVSADATLTEDEINNLIMMPGFSTADVVSDISGRGVGMDVVRTNIQEIGGRLSLQSVRGKGTIIQFALPLTLAVMDGMVIKVGRETYVMPMSMIVECLRPPRSSINNLVGTRGMLQLRGDLVPLVYLGDLLHIGSSADLSGECVVIITDAGDGTRLGLVADELCGHQQVVVKSIEESYGPVPGVAAATILGNGSVALILDVEKLSDLAGGSSSSIAAQKANAIAKVA